MPRGPAYEFVRAPPALLGPRSGVRPPGAKLSENEVIAQIVILLAGGIGCAWTLDQWVST